MRDERAGAGPARIIARRRADAPALLLEWGHSSSRSRRILRF